ncbi:MAG: MBL fold metallo-hydrolase [Clostridia bacterium]|nr:MBL fold metallo-hydrolase [Clostridia bacterium]
MWMKTLTVGMISTNCYLIGREEGDDCLVIDPGAEGRRILTAAEGRRIAAVLLTHGHFDHIAGIPELAKLQGAPLPIYIHSLDQAMLTDPALNASLSLLGRKVVSLPATNLVAEGETLSLAGLDIQVLHTPGHTPGGVCYLTEGHLFTGDTLFHHGWGRTDLPGGSQKDLFASLRRLMPLARTLPVYPGHED